MAGSLNACMETGTETFLITTTSCQLRIKDAKPHPSAGCLGLLWPLGAATSTVATASSSPSRHDSALGPPGLGELETGTSPGPPVSSEVIHRLRSSAVLWFQLCAAPPVAPRPRDETPRGPKFSELIDMQQISPDWRLARGQEGAGPAGQATCDTFTDLDLHHAIAGTSVEVRLLLYTRPNMNLTRPTTFIIHGFRPTGAPPVWLAPMAAEVLAREDCNVVVVDWNYGATNIDYFRVARNTRITSPTSPPSSGPMEMGHIDFYPTVALTNKAVQEQSSLCDHQRSVFLFKESLQQKCEIRVFPCAAYTDFLDGRCTNCTDFGYDVVKWKDSLTNYWLDIVTWNQEIQWGYITIKLYNKNQSAKATIDHKKLKFEKYTEIRLLAQFDRHMETVERMSVTFSSAIVLGPKHKLRVLRLRLQRLEGSDRPLCRYDFLLRQKKEISFRPIPCEESNF
ncbi:hypothetical protein CRUP_028694 [Coryphaenoides rupestris]|nr:hypothetical protein CRUP_028694 [Coryphaenoides rupestris]